MKLKKISAACALAVAAMSGPAMAASPLPFDTPDLKVYLGGATAPDNFLQTIATGVFEAGFHFYQDDGGTSSIYTDDGLGWRAFFGTVVNTDSTIPAALQGKKVLFVKRSRGGSVWGVDPVARANRMATIKIATPDCPLQTNNVGTTTNTVTAYRCPIVGVDPGLPGYLASTDGEVPDFGVSDVEPALFKGPYNVEFGQSQLSTAETARLLVKPVNTLMMGFAATNSVPATTYLSRADYAAMLSNKLQDWGQVDPTITTGNTNVVVCRRVPGSGTQASYNWFFNNFPCQGSFGGTLAPATMRDDSFNGISAGDGSQGSPFEIDPVGGYTVVENPGSGDVRNCMTAAQAHTDYTFKADDGTWFTIKFGNSTDPFRAIGVLSVDSFNSATVGAAPTVGWSFRSMDGAGIFDARSTGATAQTFTAGPGTGIPPSKVNLLTGKYDFAVELAMQYRTVDVTNLHSDLVLSMTNGANSLKKSFIDLFIARAGSPSFNTGPVTAALPPTYTPTLDAGGIPTNNVAKGTRSGNTCSPLQKLL